MPTGPEPAAAPLMLDPPSTGPDAVGAGFRPVVSSDQGMGRWTSVRVEGPGAASAIQGPGVEGSTTPSSSQV